MLVHFKLQNYEEVSSVSKPVQFNVFTILIFIRLSKLLDSRHCLGILGPVALLFDTSMRAKGTLGHLTQICLSFYLLLHIGPCGSFPIQFFMSRLTIS